MILDEQREQGERRHESDLQDRSAGKQHQHAGPVEHKSQAFARIAEKRTCLNRSDMLLFGLWNHHEQQGNDGKCRRGDINHHHPMEGHKRKQQRSQRWAKQTEQAVDRLIESADASIVLLGHHQSCGSSHGRPVEASAQRSGQHDNVNMPHLHRSGPKQIGQPESHQGNKRVGHDHDNPTIPSINQGPDKGTKKDLRSQSDQ